MPPSCAPFRLDPADLTADDIASFLREFDCALRAALVSAPEPTLLLDQVREDVDQLAQGENADPDLMDALRSFLRDFRI